MGERRTNIQNEADHRDQPVPGRTSPSPSDQVTKSISPGEAVARKCPLCQADDASAFWRKEALNIVRCRRCTMIYANPVESELVTGKFYDRLSQPFYLSPDKLESDYAPVRFEREVRLFRRYCTEGEVLDVGCSTGAFLYHLKQTGAYAVTGTDVAGAALEYAAGKGMEVIRAPFPDYDFGNRRFDAITFWAVIEHLVEPAKFLAQASHLLRSGGYCFVLVPNLFSLATRLCGVNYRYVMPDHVNYFSSTTLRRLVESFPDLEVVMTGSMHFNPVVIWQDFRNGPDRVPDADRARLLKRTTTLKQKPWMRPVKLAYGLIEALLGSLMLADNLVIVLRKK